MSDGLGDQLLSRVVQLRIAVLAIVTHQRVRERDVDLRVDPTARC